MLPDTLRDIYCPFYMLHMTAYFIFSFWDHTQELLQALHPGIIPGGLVSLHRAAAYKANNLPTELLLQPLVHIFM